jgi:alpha-methylacyl-CoA racemase
MHAHAASRAAFITLDGVVQPAPAPRFDRSVPDTPKPAPEVGQHTVEVLSEAGFTRAEIEALGTVAARP